MSSNESNARRSYGSGRLYARTDGNGSETWYGSWYSNGRRVKKRVGPKRTDTSRKGLTKPQAEAELRRLIAETVVAPASTGGSLTIGEAAVRYVEHLEVDGRKPVTIAAVRGHLAHWHEPFFAGKALDAIKPEDVADLVSMMRSGRRPGGLNRSRPLAPKTIRNAVGTLSALLEFAQRKGWVAANVVRRVDLPAVPTGGEIRFLTPVQVAATVDAVAAGDYQASDRALVLMAAMTGLRVGELVALRWGDVDWPAARVRVRRNYDSRNPGDGYGTPKSRRSSRSVPLADEVARALDGLSRSALGADDDGLVFADPLTNGPQSKRRILLRFRAALGAAGLDTTHRFHDLRHSFGTQLAGVGIPMRTLQEFMGHADFATTLRYADYAPSLEHERDLVSAAFARGNNRGNKLSESKVI